MIDVLICDDALFMRKYLQKIIEKSGNNVVAEAKNPDEAIDFYEEHKPDLVLLDIIMPAGKKAVDGIEALAHIMKGDPKAKVVMCSSMGQDKLVNEAKDLGAKDFIAKPFKPQEIIRVLSKYS
jgi:two-component system chemotaxis response regulator CheY